MAVVISGDDGIGDLGDALDAKADDADVAAKANTADVNTALASKLSAAGGDLTGRTRIITSGSVTGSDWQNSQLELQTPTTGNPAVTFHASGASAASIFHPRGAAEIRVGMWSGTGVATPGTSIRNITASTSAPSGGTDGDVWLVYV
jgi:hypothetical protein